MISEERILQSDLQLISPQKRKINGLVLDIGGGGEGIIGLLYGECTVSIDNLKEELDEVKNESLKIIMDACKLKFLEESFSMATFFYSLMYMGTIAKEKALSEAARVLKKNGVLEIWDTEIPECDESEKDIFIANLEVVLNGEIITTGYGVGLEYKQQTIKSICALIEKYGMSIKKSKSIGKAFHIVATK